MKKLFLLVLISAMLIPNITLAQEDIKVTLNGEIIKFDVMPVIENGRTLVPLRAIFEALGADVYWHEETEGIVAVKNNTKLFMNVGSSFLTKAEIEEGADAHTVSSKILLAPTSLLDVPAKVVNGRTLVPIRAISEALDVNVEWNGDTQTVILTADQGYIKNLNKDKNFFDVFVLTTSFEENIKLNPVMFIDAHNDMVLGMRDYENCEIRQNENDSQKTDILITLTDEGREKFFVKTSQIAGYGGENDYMCMLHGGNVVAVFRIVDAIDSKVIIITGTFTEETTNEILLLINKK